MFQYLGLITANARQLCLATVLAGAENYKSVLLNNFELQLAAGTAYDKHELLPHRMLTRH